MDLRLIISVLKINNDLERIGDLSKSIAKRTKSILKSNNTFKNNEHKIMLEKAFEMLKFSLSAFTNQDVILAKKVITMDEEVDTRHGQLIKELENSIDQKELTGSVGLSFFSFIHSIERIADLSVNIAEDIIYLIEGKIIRHQKIIA